MAQRIELGAEGAAGLAVAVAIDLSAGKVIDLAPVEYDAHAGAARHAIAFEATSDSLPGVVRQFTSLSACADEIGISRIYGGIYFAFDNVEGKRSGAAIGEHVSANFLLANSDLPQLRQEGVGADGAEVRVFGRAGTLTVLEASGDLERWMPVATNAFVSGGILVRDVESIGALMRFYRAREE